MTAGWIFSIGIASWKAKGQKALNTNSKLTHLVNVTRDLELAKGERHAIIGRNGAGKSTVFNLVIGCFPQSSGAVYLHGRNLLGLAPYQITRLGLSRSFQITNIFQG